MGQKTYELTIEFHENGRAKSLSNTYNSEYGSLNDVLSDSLVDRIIKIIKSNRENIEKEPT